MRWVACFCLAGLLYEAAMGSTPAACSVSLGAVLCAMGDFYARQGIGKLRLAGDAEWYCVASAQRLIGNVCALACKKAAFLFSV